MTDTSTTGRMINRRLALPRLSFPKLAIGASLKAISVLVGNSVKMSYVDPYTSIGRQPQIVPNDDLQGRDPSW
ncbi:hypothetical protein [Mesorhizobium sp. WSM3860]|uniref:hypothetical protein n=1 Tax=Mesorhizobium sp. WSM3860 TaxID=2029403 RepID=UPI000BAEC67D|nr:hypothetical protein [Mesorhizobium sp. WSM3860]PBC01711.1 hypothetical protein CK220_24010 [Mesorhizobium sp. WSM3860]